MKKTDITELSTSPVVITPEQVRVIKNTVAVGATDEELKLFFYECRRRGVHPLDRLIHFIKRRGADGTQRATFQAGIDFLRGQAEETGEYRGQDAPEFGPIREGKDEQGHTYRYPEWAKVTVRRKDPDTGEIYSITAVAYWDEYYPGEKIGFMWRKMPRGQLAKCAEALALRKAFPRQIAGLYVFEEMEQADSEPARPPIVQPKTIEQKTPDEEKPHSLRDSLEAALQELSGLTGVPADELVQRYSVFVDKEGRERAAGSLDGLLRSERWARSTLGRLREAISDTQKNREPGEEG